MENTFMKEMEERSNYKLTENGGIAHSSTLNAVLDLFAMGAAYRNRSIEDCILLFKNAYEEDPTLALKCLFYIGDCRGGQGERRFFRVCFNWLAKEHPLPAKRLVAFIPFYRRWDDMIYSCFDTSLEEEALTIIKSQLFNDLDAEETPSLLAKWLPSENASSYTTKKAASKIRKFLDLTHKEYRLMLSGLRKKIQVLERTMSANEWDNIKFDKIPSKAGLIYSHAFARRPEIAKRYSDFVNNKTTKVNAETLYPYDIVRKAIKLRNLELDYPDRKAVNKYWENQKDYLNGASCKMLCVCDTSGSMTWGSFVAPIDVAISLSLYCAERVGGPFKDSYISFSSRPQLIKTKGVDFVDKVDRIYNTNLCENTDLIATFELLKEISLKAKPEDRLDTIVVISDMEIDAMTTFAYKGRDDDHHKLLTEMERERKRWEDAGLTMPKLVYWNVDARENTILDLGPDVSFVSGASPSIFEGVLTGKTGMELMLDRILNPRYEVIFA